MIDKSYYMINQTRTQDRAGHTVEHSKYWIGCVQDDNSVLTRWGRLGTKGQSKIFPYSSELRATGFLNTKVNDKLRNGYRIVKEAEFRRLDIMSRVLGIKHRIAEVQWVEIARVGVRDPSDVIDCKLVPESRLAMPDCTPGLRICAGINRSGSLPANYSTHYFLVTIVGDTISVHHSRDSTMHFVPLSDDSPEFLRSFCSNILEAIEQGGI